MRVVVFPDTNVLLHFQFFDEVDWPAQLGVKELTIVLAQPVLGELDDHKSSGTRREKARAQKVLKRLDALDLSTTPTPLRKGVSVMALDSEPTDALFSRHRLSTQVVDDRLLASVLEFTEATPGCRVLILTDDTGLRVKARGRRLDVVAPAESLRSEEEADDTERALETARRELAAAKSAVPQLRVTFESGDHLELQVRPAGPLDPAVREDLLARFRARHPHVSPMPESVSLPGGLHMNINTTVFRGLPSFLTREDAQNHNEAVNRVLDLYTAYLDAWPSMLNGLKRCVEIRLVLENEGTAPADDVHIELWTDARGIWREEQPNIDRPPTMPRERSMFDIALRSLPIYNPPDLRRHDDPIDGPNILEDDPTEAQYAVRRVKHHLPCALPAVYFQFETDEDIGSFAIEYRIVAANIREPREGALNIRISLHEPMPAPDPDQVFEAPQASDD